MASPLREAAAGELVALGRGQPCGVQSAGRGKQGGFLDLVDRPLLVAVLDPARPAAGADGDRVQTKGDGDQGRSAQRAAWHQRTSLVISLVTMGWLYGQVAGLGRSWY